MMRRRFWQTSAVTSPKVSTAAQAEYSFWAWAINHNHNHNLLHLIEPFDRHTHRHIHRVFGKFGCLHTHAGIELRWRCAHELALDVWPANRTQWVAAARRLRSRTTMQQGADHQPHKAMCCWAKQLGLHDAPASKNKSNLHGQGPLRSVRTHEA